VAELQQQLEAEQGVVAELAAERARHESQLAELERDTASVLAELEGELERERTRTTTVLCVLLRT
jgi:septal ring factor EnvC (AmiA/AmiB activator)